MEAIKLHVDADAGLDTGRPVLILLHIVFMPLVAGMAYEITRRAGKRPDFLPWRVLLWPGLAFQGITTRPPDDSMIEVALTAFHEALDPKHLSDPPCGRSAS